MAAQGSWALPGEPAWAPSTAVLVVDPEASGFDALRRTLGDDFELIHARNLAAARETLERAPVAVVLCDQRLPPAGGLAFLREVQLRWPDTVRIVLAGASDSDTVQAAMADSGVQQWLLKPWVPDQLLARVHEAVQARALGHDARRLHDELRAAGRGPRPRPPLRRPPQGFDFDRLARAPGSPLDALCVLAERLARVDLAVLISGESGTGKELLARAMHFASPRAAGPFVMENCAALADTLLESELFGHKRGSFTGAVDDHVGLLQRAHGGTVFLDEIGETSPAFQVKLLRVLQEGELRPVGSARSVPVDVRVLSATHRDLAREVAAGRFREDLYYRLVGATLHIPPLRARPSDIAPVAARLLADVAAELGRAPLALHPGALACLMNYPWPGNVREMRNEIARAIALAEGPVIEPALLSPHVLRGDGAATGSGNTPAPTGGGSLAERLEALEATILRETMLRHRWNKSSAAKELALSRVGLRAKLQRFGMLADTVARKLAH